jgi:hypothetical protein
VSTDLDNGTGRCPHVAVRDNPVGCKPWHLCSRLASIPGKPSWRRRRAKVPRQVASNHRQPLIVNGQLAMSDIAFNIRLAEADWEDSMSGWRCPALNVPGAEVEDVYVEGARADRAKYEVLPNHSIIRWIPGDRPPRATASIKLTKALSLGTETDKWRRLAIILPVIATVLAAIISGSATYFSRSPVLKTDSGAAQVGASNPQAGHATGNEIADYIDIIDKKSQNIEIGKTYLSRFSDSTYIMATDHPEEQYKFHVTEGVHRLELFFELRPGNKAGVPAFLVLDQNERSVGRLSRCPRLV